jgi:hypothetical protein
MIGIATDNQDGGAAAALCLEAVGVCLGLFFLRSEFKLRRVWREVPEIHAEKKNRALGKSTQVPVFCHPHHQGFNS